MDSVFSVTKGRFAKVLRRHFNQRHPSLINNLSTKHLIVAQAFVDGYALCLNKMKEDPANPSEVEDLLLNETLQFIDRLLQKESLL